MLLREIQLEQEFGTIYEDMDASINQQRAPLGKIDVDYSQMDLPQLQQLMQQILKLMSIHGKLKPGPTRSRHAGRIMGYLNKVRGAVTQALKLNESDDGNNTQRALLEKLLLEMDKIELT